MFQFGRYIVRDENLFRAGGMGNVYLAWDPEFKREVVIKAVRKDRSELFQVFKQRFNKEKFITAKLHEANLKVVHVYDAGVESGIPYMVMRYMTGGTLQSRCGKMSPEEIVQVFRQLAVTIDSIHRHNIIHRDLKPSNILFDRTDDVFIADFGVAWSTGETDDPADAKTIITQSSDPATYRHPGTPRYMSPEQFGSGNLTPQSDIYAMGIVLLQMMIGDAYFPGPDGTIPDLGRFTACEPVIKQAIAYKPQDRFTTLVRMVDALEACLGSATDITIITDPPEKPKKAIKLELVRTLGRLDGVPRKLVFSPSGQHLIILTDVNFYICHVNSVNQLSPLSPQDKKPIKSICFLTDEYILLHSDTIDSWEVTGKRRTIPIYLMPHPSRRSNIRHSPIQIAVSFQGQLMATVDNGIHIWQSDRQRRSSFSWLHKVDISGRSIQTLAFSPHQDLLAWASRDQVGIWDVRKKQGREIKLHGDKDGLIFSPDQSTLVIIDKRGQIHSWQLGRPEEELFMIDFTRYPVAADPQWHYWASGGQHTAIDLWDMKTNDRIAELPKTALGHESNVVCITFNQQGSFLASGDENGKICLTKIKFESEP